MYLTIKMVHVAALLGLSLRIAAAIDQGDPSAPCPEELPEQFSFCDEPFGQGYFDFVSDTCTYSDEVCCPSTGECTPPIECGCNLRYLEVSCRSRPLVCPDFCPESAPLESELCDIQVTGCDYGECPYDLSSEATSCECDVFSGEWSCSDSCPACPFSQPVSGDPCVPEFTTEECDYNYLGYCSGVLFYGTTCQCNPDTSLFECTTHEDIVVDPWTCPSAPCPEELPEESSFCDEPFGPDIYSFSEEESDTCEYTVGDTFCCPSTGECTPPIECGCNLQFSQVDCFRGSVECTEVCAEAPPETGDVCDIPGNVLCYYEFGKCGFSPTISSYDCTCQDGFYDCIDFCDNGSAPCPEDTPESSSLFCDEAFGPGFFDGGLSDMCFYDEATCCESTGECVSAFNCGCNVTSSEVSCGPFIACPDFCPEATPETGNACDIPLAVDCLYDFGECGFSPDESTTLCFCENGVFVCHDFCGDGSSPTAPPMEDTGMEGGMMGMSGGMKGGGMGGMKMGKTSKSKEARSLGVTKTLTTRKHRRGVYRGS